MIFVITAGLLFFFTVVCTVSHYHTYPNRRWIAVGTRGILASATVVIVGCIVLFIGSMQQSRDLQQIRLHSQVKGVYQGKAKALMAHFTKHVENTSPECKSKSQYNKASTIQMYFAICPSLQYSTSLVVWANRIDTLQSRVYDLRRKADFVRERLRRRSQNPWYMWLTPLVE